MSKYISKFLRRADQGTDILDTLGSQGTNRLTDNVDTLTMSRMSVSDSLISHDFEHPQPGDLDSWLELVGRSQTIGRVLEVVDQFRPYSWSDKERAIMGKEYVLQIERLRVIID